jgi:glycosyltransferase involved in cell wall biosynthesis
MRVVFVSSSFNVGGAERQWSILLPRLVERGHSVQLITLKSGGRFLDDLQRAGIDVRCADLRRRLDAVKLYRIFGLVNGDPDLIVSWGTSAAYVGRAIAWRYRASLVANDHRPVAADGTVLPRRFIQSQFLRLIAGQVDALIAVSESQVSSLSRSGFDRGRIRVVPNGVAAAQIVPPQARAKIREQVGIQQHEFAVLLLAALRPEKRIDRFVRAIGIATSADARVIGFVAGEGPERARLTGLEHAAVHFLGARADVHDLLAAVDAVALSSAYEALPMALLEAMAAGKPLVAFDVGGVRDLVQPGKTGILVTDGDTSAMAAAVLELAQDPELAAKLGTGAKRLQRRLYTLEHMVEEFERVLVEVAGGDAAEMNNRALAGAKT